LAKKSPPLIVGEIDHGLAKLQEDGRQSERKQLLKNLSADAFIYWNAAWFLI
jgi:hypothetical protein